MTVKPFREDTGFAEFDKPPEGEDLVAIELNSNTGLITIEEGTLHGTEIRLEVRYKKSFLGATHPSVFLSAKRSFRLLAEDLLEERVVLENALGDRRKWLKRYRKTFDYLKDF
uniref:PX domain-containing protein n=1 Tax=Steinernema glaseri TaxID=37863 RepID=A0A1I8ABQ9_9BILA